MRKEPHPRNDLCTTQLPLDFKRYEPYLSDSDLSPEQTRQLLETLFAMMVQFVDLGFAVSELQLPCGERRKTEDETAFEASSVLSSTDIPSASGLNTIGDFSGKETR